MTPFTPEEIERCHEATELGHTCRVCRAVPLGRPSPDTAAFLGLLKAEPTLLDPAPAGWNEGAVTRRTRDEVHSCLRCGGRAAVAFVALTDAGLRWLDVCPGCAMWLQNEA